MAVLDQDLQTKSTALNQLINLWKGKHLGIAHTNAAPMPVGVDDGLPPQQCRSLRGRSVCLEAGFCTCIGSRPYVPLPRAFAGAVRQWIGKDKVANTEFQQGLLVAHVFAEGAEVEHWLHTGMGNLNSERYALMSLQPSVIWMQQQAQRRRRDAVSLECPPDVWPASCNVAIRCSAGWFANPRHGNLPWQRCRPTLLLGATALSPCTGRIY